MLEEHTVQGSWTAASQRASWDAHGWGGGFGNDSVCISGALGKSHPGRCSSKASQSVFLHI